MSTRKWKFRQIVSGGQTGVDRGALDAAISMGIEHGGWCPRGRLSESGPVPARYLLTEMKSSSYRSRTEQNVVDSDATLILYRGELQGGTALTWRLAAEHGRPYLLVDLCQPLDVSVIRQWLVSEEIEVLNVAGPRESSAPGIGEQAKRFVRAIFVDRSRRNPGNRRSR